MQYTIEARELTNGYAHRTQSPLTIEADDADQAIDRFVRDCNAELMSCIRPARGPESIATVKTEDAILLVRVYSE